MKTFLLTVIALIAFAANSVLCRLALEHNAIDASSFTMIRLFSGAITLFIILKSNNKKSPITSKGSWLSSLMLFLYAIAFSFAYKTLDTGTGALILFGAVQITIILQSIISGNKLRLMEWIGAIISFLGFVYLISPGVTSPSFIGFILMAISGIAWGVYTVRGQVSINPLADTTYNFIKTIPLLIVLFIATRNSIRISTEGIVLAIVSGGITSGIGYTIWYMAIQKLKPIQTAIVQLLVPAIAAFGGVLFISEIITTRLALSSLLILGGVFVVTINKKSKK